MFVLLKLASLFEICSKTRDTLIDGKNFYCIMCIATNPTSMLCINVSDNVVQGHLLKNIYHKSLSHG